jgi:hypothetical protein
LAVSTVAAPTSVIKLALIVRLLEDSLRDDCIS